MLKGEKRNYAKIFTLELYACEFCELCVQVCPTDAIVMMKSFDMATTDRREMLLDKDRLHAIGLQHEPSWATGNRLRDMQGRRKREAGRACRRLREATAAKRGSRQAGRDDRHDAGGAGVLDLRGRARRVGARRRPHARTCFIRCCGWRWR